MFANFLKIIQPLYKIKKNDLFAKGLNEHLNKISLNTNLSTNMFFSLRDFFYEKNYYFHVSKC